MENYNLEIPKELYGKIVGASAVLDQGLEQTAMEFLEDSADVILSGNYHVIEDEQTFQRLQQIARA